ncbi:MAG TPA: RNA pseudouridine synthase [Candidatus Choladousia intestinigallinarum]|nr:RNA pseudouridine synthase [Candidatus Choladousia intestinigallinarum]
MDEYNILYEDREILVCRKPAGLPVQSSHMGTKDLESILNLHLKETGCKERIRLIHRLDQPVEGILVFAKTKRAAAGLNRQIQENQMQKTYLAVCCIQEAEKMPGSLEEDSVRLTHSLLKDAKTNASRIVPEGTKGAKRAELFCRKLGEYVLVQDKRLALVEIRLITGRHHQIRVQMAGIGMPLYGDRKYNPQWETWAKAAGEAAENASLALCAAGLNFMHPVTDKKMEFSINPSGKIFQILQKI